MKTHSNCLRRNLTCATTIALSTAQIQAQTIDLGWTVDAEPEGLLANWIPSTNTTGNTLFQFVNNTGGTVVSGVSNFSPITKWVNSPGYNLSANPNDSWQDGLGNPATQENASWELIFRPGDFTGIHTLFNSGGNGDGIAFTMNGSTLDFRFQDANSATQRVIVSTDLSTIGAETDFYYVVGVVDVDTALAGTGWLYVNGVLVDGPTTSTGTINDWDGGDLAELGKGNNIPGGNPFNPAAFTGDIAEFNYYGGELLDAAFIQTRFQNYAGADLDSVGLATAINYPTENDPVALSSSAISTVVGELSGLTAGGFPIAGTTFSLIAGAGDTDNALYTINGSELQVNGDLSGLDNALHSIRVEANSDGDTIEGVLTFTVKLDSDNDDLIDEWEETFGVIGDFSTGGDHDNDDLNDEDEYLLGLNPDDDDGDDDGALDGDEITNGTDPFDNDSDDDTLLDGVETNTGTFVDANDTGTDPLNDDSDADGLLDGVEDNGGTFVDANQTGSDPNNRDTDGDFYSDGGEVAVNRDPNVFDEPLSEISTGLLNYWSFDDESLEDVAHSQSLGDSTVADDGVFAGTNGTTGIEFSAGLFNGGIQLDGASGAAQNNGFVEVTRSDDTLFGANITNPGNPSTLTMSIWVNATGFDQNWQTMMSHGEGLQYRIARHNASNNVAHAGGSGEGPIGTGLITANTGWHHVAAVSDPATGQTRLYVNGILDSSSGNPNIDDARGGGVLNLNIGANPDTGIQNREWLGQLDDAAQWNRALDEGEIGAIYNAGVGGTSLLSLLGGGSTEFRITDIVYDTKGTESQTDDTISLTWPSREGQTFAIYFNTDLFDWTSDLDDGYDADPGDSTTFTFPATQLGDPVPNKAFFRVERQ